MEINMLSIARGSAADLEMIVLRLEDELAAHRHYITPRDNTWQAKLDDLKDKQKEAKRMLARCKDSARIMTQEEQVAMKARVKAYNKLRNSNEKT